VIAFFPTVYEGDRFFG